ncbi:MAG: DnaA regulatory inactivator Hda [Gammaproteobacteria bacterium]|nr:DnaA regulatory inactivator Hda [Gammaproteobacteria bacterium]
MTAEHPQLPLGIGLKDTATFDNFYPAGNELVLQALQEGNDAMLYLWGPVGSGKSHLLQALCHATAANGHSPVYLPLSELVSLSPALLEGLEHQALIAVDDVQTVAGLSQWEEGLFHLYNRVRDSGHRLVVSATSAPAGLALALPDLASRLGWGPVFQLTSLADTDKRAALQMRARRRGLEMGNEVAEYLLRRCPRDMDSLFNLLNRLDQASLAAQRRLTIPFVRQLLD